MSALTILTKKTIMTLIPEHHPWSDIKKPDDGVYVRKVADVAAHDFYWGRDSQGRYLLILPLEGEHADFVQTHFLKISGISIDLKYVSDVSAQGFLLILERTEDADIFLRLCNVLIDVAGKTEGSREALSVIFSQLKRWKAFLSGGGRKILRPHEIRGLFSELLFLKRLLHEEEVSPVAALEAWRGPIRGAQDFVLGDCAVEIKSLSGTARGTVRISSEDQLDSSFPRLYLRVYLLAEDSECSEGSSLNALVRELGAMITEAEALELLWDRLAHAGYVDLTNYDTPCMKPVQCRTYLVDENFPRLIPGALDAGLSGVSYELALEAAEPFRCEDVCLREDDK